ncbi:MAG: hypothetical protein KAT05_00485, partial [Spirochaetes bacterium]|nr:hypothetical protein [Spirochaetota bacterium]
MKNSNIFLLFLIFFILIVFISCIPPENNNSNDTDSEILEGSLLIINSWGEGLWENVPDGKYRITFDAAKKVNLVGYLWAKDQNDPKAILRFNITHALRSDCEIKVVIGDSSSDTSIFYKNFINLYMGMGDQPFPSNDMIVDITEAYQYLNTKNIYLVVYDKTDNIATGTVDKVKLQVWNTNSYDQTPDDYDATYDSVDPSGTATQNGIYKTFEFTSHKGTIGFANPLFKGTMNKSNLIVLTDKPSSDKLAKLKAQMGTHQKG